MIKITFAVMRRPDIDLEEFDRYWREDHAALLLRHRRALGFVRYSQTPTSHRGLIAAMASQRGCLAPFDGVADMWFASTESMLEHGRSAESQAANVEILTDEARFIDLSRSSLMIGDERPIHPAPGDESGDGA